MHRQNPCMYVSELIVKKKKNLFTKYSHYGSYFIMNLLLE